MTPGFSLRRMVFRRCTCTLSSQPIGMRRPLAASTTGHRSGEAPRWKRRGCAISSPSTGGLAPRSPTASIRCADYCPPWLTRLRAATCSPVCLSTSCTHTPSDVTNPHRSAALVSRRTRRERGVVLRHSSEPAQHPHHQGRRRPLPPGPRRHVAARRATARAARAPL